MLRKKYNPDENRIPGFTNEKELQYLYDTTFSILSKDGIGEVLEIGSYQGRSAHAIASALSDNDNVNSLLVCIDDWSQDGASHNAFIDNMTAPRFKLNILVKDGKNEEFVNNFEDESFDMIFIDGNHEYEEVMKDFKNWYSKLRQGGILLGHDYRRNVSERVAKAVNEFFGKENFSLIKGGTIFKHIKPIIKCYPKGFVKEL